MERPCKHCGKLRQWTPKQGAQPEFCGIDCKFRFHFSVGDDEQCWEWNGPRNAKNYGVLGKSDKRNVLAHRFSYELHRAPIPTGFFVLHKCDNPPCVNPAHLFIGTAKDNSADCVAKRRNSPPPRAYGSANIFSKNAAGRLGENHHSAKLTEKKVRDILRSEESSSILGRKYGVNRQVIWQIRTGKIWKRVQRPH
jgi:hypothetical protein